MVGVEKSMNSMSVTVFGVSALSFMMVMYALERRHSGFVLAFAAGCIMSSVYGFLSGAWPFGVVELVWSAVAVRRYLMLRRGTPKLHSAAIESHPSRGGSRGATRWWGHWWRL